MQEYLDIFIDEVYPDFIDKYLKTKTLTRLKDVTQFCGCDYTKLFNPLFLFTRFDHSVVVAHMTWHFTHDKKETIAALLHDIGTPCFAHCIDYVFGDYIKQESSEKDILDIIKQDALLLKYLKEDGIKLEDLGSLESYQILENKSPKLCADRLDGVLHTAYVWIHTHPLEDIKEVYDDIVVLENEDGKKEIGFKTKKNAEKFVSMIYVYAKELQSNEDKYVTEYVAEMVKLAFENNLLTLEDLYTKKETELTEIFAKNFSSWKNFCSATALIRTDDKPKHFHSSYDTKKRNVIPLVRTKKGSERINKISTTSEKLYTELKNYQDSKYAYIEKITTSK